jgi:CRISPR-associated protein (TIGR03986 family)
MSGRTPTVQQLYPVMISRDLFELAPAAIVGDGLRPAMSLTELSAADRVFGWVNRKGSGAVRGRLRIGPVRCETADPIEDFTAGQDGDPNGVPLAILGEPKPAQTRFYAASNGSGAPMRNNDRTYPFSQAAKTSGSTGVRGWKTYPHHAHLPAGYWNRDVALGRTMTGQEDVPVEDGVPIEYRRAGARPGTTDRRDSQNRSIASWVKPGVAFTFTIDVGDVGDIELGALLWLLNLPGGERPAFHRLGGGKPLGFGSVRMEIAHAELWTGAERGAAWKELREPVADIDADTLIARFAEAMTGEDGAGAIERLERMEPVKSFLVAARGYLKPLPVRTPRRGRAADAADAEGENFKWFQENERNPDGRRALPSLSSEHGLPGYP